MGTTKIALFRGKKIRKTLFQNEWWFSVVDVIFALTDSANPRDYWYRMKVRVKEEDGDGKMRETDCADTEGILRIIQSKYPKRLLELHRTNIKK